MEPPWGSLSLSFSLSLSHSSDTMSRGLEDATYIPLPKVDYRAENNTL